MDITTDPLDKALTQLTPIQKVLVQECLEKKSGGLSLPMGEYGKTFLSLAVSLIQRRNLPTPKLPVLVVVGKTLVGGWIAEIKKFFGDSLNYTILHKDYLKDIDAFVPEYDLVIVTINNLQKAYKAGDVESHFVMKELINEGRFNQHTINYYYNPDVPFLSVPRGLMVLFSVKWSCVIIDEVHKYTNITTGACQSVGALCTHHRWALSGTIFDEPKTEKILGYYVIIGDETFPRSLPDAKKFVKSRRFRGYEASTVYRGRNKEMILPEITEHTITHKLFPEEELLYTSIRKVMTKIHEEYQKYKAEENTVKTREFGSYLLAVLTYLRQSVVCPLIPITKVILDASDLKCKSELSRYMMNELQTLELGEWLSDKGSVRSSRIQEVIKVINNHPNERIIVFTCSRKGLNVVKYYVDAECGRPSFVVDAKMTGSQRSKTFEDLAASDNGVLFLTYEIGAEGHNLQCANVVLIVDFWWNDGKTQQATHRAYRPGQTKDCVVYYFMSNTGVEQAIFAKQADKLKVLGELKIGKKYSKVKKLRVQELIKMIEEKDIASEFQRIKL